MKPLFLTRREYDILLTQHGQWVKDNWHMLGRKWSIEGVLLDFFSEDQLAFVAAFLARHR